MKGISVLTLLVQVFFSASAFIDSKLIPNTTIYLQKVGFDKEVTKTYRNLRQRRFLAWGDGVIDGTDVWDDFNIKSGDGCSSICQVETGYTCPIAGNPWVEICGDGLDLGSYQCDDGNPFSGDGCSSTCQLEPTGFTWVKKPFPSVCTEKCGDGINFGNYQCDDGNTANGDGWSSTCNLEAGFWCDRESCDDICGDGLKGGGSQNWDDGNVIWGDGWDKHCTAMAGFTCTSTFPTTCSELWDGLDFYFWPWEDGNSVAGDGWKNCAVETSFQWTEGDPLNPDVCKEIWGDGLDYFNYHCDDGNYNSGDGCSVLCLPEVGYLWTGGTHTNPDTWPEICGDGLNFGWYEWDDGNLINGDGCDDKWKVEKYWTWYWGNPTRKDKCEEKCGDGVDILINACEDSNVLEWDGWNKYWQIEEGWTCSGGSLTGPDKCVEYFGDGCRVGKEEWDDKNLVNGDGWSSLMKIETGYTCSGGNLTTSKDDFCLRANTTSPDYWACKTTAKDVWTEIWGDGIDVHVWQCDDGNLRDYDGWSSTWMIEKGWTWTGDTPDICTMLPRPYVDYLYVNTDNTALYVVFNEAMILYTGWQATDFNIYMTGYQDYYDFTWSLRNSNLLKVSGNKTFIFDIDIKDQMAGYNHEKIHVQFLNDQYFRSESTTLKLLNWTVSTYTYQHASKQDDQCSIKYPLYGFWTTFALVWIIVMIYWYRYMHSMTPLWMIISSFQILNIYCTMDLYIPTCLLNFYIDIEKLSFLELPSIRNSLNPVKNDGLSRRFNDFGWDSPAFLVNILSILFVFIFLLPLIPLKWLKNRPFKNEKVAEVIRRYWDQWLVVVLLLTFTRLTFAWVINFVEFRIDVNNILTTSTVFTVYTFMSLSMVIFFFTYLGIHTYHRTKSDRISIEVGTQRPEMAEGSADPGVTTTRIMSKFLEDIDVRKAPAPFHYTVYLLRRLLWVLILVYWRDNEIASLICLTCLNTAALLWMIYVRPYKTNLNNRLGIFVEAWTLWITLCIFPYIRAWPPKHIYLDFARYQFYLVWFMLLMIPIIIFGDHFWMAKIMKLGYFHKPHRTIFESKKPKRLIRAKPAAPEPPKPEEPQPEEKPKEEPKETKKPEPAPKSEKTETEGEDSEESEDESQEPSKSEVSESQPEESRQESSVDDSVSVNVTVQKPRQDDGIELNILSSDINNAHTSENFGNMNFTREMRKF